MINADQHPRVGVGVIVIRDGKVLIGKRINAHGSSTWNFPGGHLEMNENIEDCAKREVKEETRLDVKIIGQGPYTNDIFREEGKHYITIFVIAKSNHGEAKLMEPDKCEGWQWVNWSKLPKPMFLPLENLLKTDFSINEWI